MKYRKTTFGLCVALGVIIGGFLGIVSGELLLGAISFGAIVGALVFIVIDWIIARRRTSLQPYDQLDEHHQSNNSVNNPTPEASLRAIEDGHIDQYMPFRLPKR